jgi:hypothetical protein
MLHHDEIKPILKMWTKRNLTAIWAYEILSIDWPKEMESSRMVGAELPIPPHVVQVILTPERRFSGGVMCNTKNNHKRFLEFLLLNYLCKVAQS